MDSASLCLVQYSVSASLFKTLSSHTWLMQLGILPLVPVAPRPSATFIQGLLISIDVNEQHCSILQVEAFVAALMESGLYKDLRRPIYPAMSQQHAVLHASAARCVPLSGHVPCTTAPPCVSIDGLGGQIELLDAFNLGTADSTAFRRSARACSYLVSLAATFAGLCCPHHLQAPCQIVALPLTVHCTAGSG